MRSQKMTSYSSNLVKKTKDLKLKDDQFINILLLGETGVGKSTFINSLANYLTYSDFKKAEKETLVILIPSKCEVKDKHDEYHIINIGSEEDQNECLDTGMSATQDVKSYVFPISNGNIKVRLIDTPGIGDVRGVAQDNINCENILDYIGQLHELHAICYLFKPTNPRITVYFDYCMTQILSRLDKSASKNIIFIFTNTRGTDYSPGDTFPSLQKVIDGIKAKPPHVDIPLSRKNVFCFDNEAFRYLAAIQKGVAFDGPTKQRNHESWKRSVQQCLR
ncbi:hypothetical protein NQ315_002459 [Exocentrus adspersus]|uniref:Septin-type G domain-containing protein n=1 Tax=Exocentrus adspersus TaxID=1586481 RepID=A0AAV8V8G5_9CUCU|nr:hypothetical protein NQ315_002459 [Exocentrus adspersus]